MSKKTLSALKNDIRNQVEYVDSVENELKYLDKAIYNAMDDRVGYSARKSLASIMKRFSLNMDNGLKNAAQSANTLDNGYGKTDAHSAQAEDIATRAQALVDRLGDI